MQLYVERDTTEIESNSEQPEMKSSRDRKEALCAILLGFDSDARICVVP